MSQRIATSVESFAHQEAKRLFCSWLRDAAAAAGRDEHVDFAGLSWRVNRGAPHWGVWLEYPVLADHFGIVPVWDEAHPRWAARPPSYEEVIGLGLRPMAVLDIAVQHKGRITFAIEVVHKHKCDPRKVALLQPEVALIEIPAYWVLGQVGKPTAIPDDFWVT